MGAVYRVCQFLTMVYLAVTLVLNSTWAYSEVPVGMINAWLEEGAIQEDAGLDSFASLPYCADPAAFSFAYSASYHYDSPKCVAIHPWEFGSKGQTLHIATSIIEVRETAWPCSAPSDADEHARCAARNGTVATTHSGAQCRCSSRRTLYPVGPERLNMAFEHTVGVETDTAFHVDTGGSSSVAEGEEGAVTTTVLGVNGTTFQEFAPGGAIRMSVAEWLAASGVNSLDAHNTDLADRDYRDGTAAG